MANIAVNQAVPGATALMNVAAKAMNPIPPTTPTPTQEAVNPILATNPKQEAIKP